MGGDVDAAVMRTARSELLWGIHRGRRARGQAVESAAARVQVIGPHSQASRCSFGWR